MRQVLEKLKSLKPNISKEERLAIKSLQNDENIILLADKGNATVVIDKVEYSNKLADLIGNGGYCKVKKDPTLRQKESCRRSLVRTKISYYKWNTDNTTL